MKAIREKIRAEVGESHHLPRSLRDLIAKVNPILRGWGNYFSKGNSAQQFNTIDSYMQERLYLYLSKKHGTAGRGWGERWKHINFSKEGLYHLGGTVRWHKEVKAAG